MSVRRGVPKLQEMQRSPLWEQLTTSEQEAFIRTLVNHVKYDGTTGEVTIGFYNRVISRMLSPSFPLNTSGHLLPASVAVLASARGGGFWTGTCGFSALAVTPAMVPERSLYAVAAHTTYLKRGGPTPRIHCRHARMQLSVRCRTTFSIFLIR